MGGIVGQGHRTGEVALSSSWSSTRSVWVTKTAWAFSQTWPMVPVVDFQKTRAGCSKPSSQKMAQVPAGLPVPGVREPVFSELGFHGPPVHTLDLAMCPEPLLSDQMVTLPSGALSRGTLSFLSGGEGLPFQNSELCKEPGL